MLLGPFMQREQGPIVDIDLVVRDAEICFEHLRPSERSRKVDELVRTYMRAPICDVDDDC